MSAPPASASSSSVRSRSPRSSESVTKYRRACCRRSRRWGTARMYPRLAERGAGVAAREGAGLDEAEGPLGGRGDAEAAAEVATRVRHGDGTAQVLEAAAARPLLDLHRRPRTAGAGVTPYLHGTGTEQANEEGLAIGQEHARLVAPVREPQSSLPGAEQVAAAGDRHVLDRVLRVAHHPRVAVGHPLG